MDFNPDGFDQNLRSRRANPAERGVHPVRRGEGGVKRNAEMGVWTKPSVDEQEGLSGEPLQHGRGNASQQELLDAG